MSERDPVDIKAVALRYDREAAQADATAPQVVAKGSGWVADRILALAREHGVPVREDKDLVALLSACDLGQEITPEMYAAVAELLAWLYRCNRELDQ
jgi:flagellar biosynthesis protein